MAKKQIRLVVGVPHSGRVHSEFVASLVALFHHCHVVPLPGADDYDVSLLLEQSSLLSAMRHNIVQLSLRAEATHVLMIDSDQTFPADTAHKLLACGRPIVGCNVATKRIPASPTARAFDAKDPAGSKVFTDNDSRGVQEVWRLGFGVLLVDAGVFRRVPPPHFEVRWQGEAARAVGPWWAHEPGGSYRGEDWAFCERVQQYGYKVHMMQGLSRLIGHVGDFEFRHEHVGEVRRVTA